VVCSSQYFVSHFKNEIAYLEARVKGVWSAAQILNKKIKKS
jgi:hypothetical protein